MTWRVAQLYGRHGLIKSRPGHITYWRADGCTRASVMAWLGASSQAKLIAAKLNGEPLRLSAEEFDEAVEGVPMQPGTREALRLIVVEGQTWAQAAKAGGLTESGIKRAFDRVHKRQET